MRLNRSAVVLVCVTGLVMVGGVELRAVAEPSGVVAGDRVEVTIRPEDCIVFMEG